MERDLTTEEFQQYRGVIGKLNWLSEQMRLDIGYNTLLVSYHTKDVKVQHLKEAKKVIVKARGRPCKILFKKIAKFEDLIVINYTDAAYLKVENNLKSVAGRVLFMADKK